MTKTKGGRKAQGQRQKVRHLQPWCEAKMPELSLRARPSQERLEWGRAGVQCHDPLSIATGIYTFRVLEGQQKGEGKGKGRAVKGTAYYPKSTKGRLAPLELWTQCPMCWGKLLGPLDQSFHQPLPHRGS